MKPIGGDIAQIEANIGHLRELQDETVNAQRKVIKCLQCGLPITFTSKQYKIKCGCGNWIKRGDYIHITKAETCRWCDDKGYLFYQTQVENQYIDKSARCVCQAGKVYGNGKLPCITEVTDAPADFVNQVIFDMADKAV